MPDSTWNKSNDVGHLCHSEWFLILHFMASLTKNLFHSNWYRTYWLEVDESRSAFQPDEMNNRPIAIEDFNIKAHHRPFLANLPNLYELYKLIRWAVWKQNRVSSKVNSQWCIAIFWWITIFDASAAALMFLTSVLSLRVVCPSPMDDDDDLRRVIPLLQQLMTGRMCEAEAMIRWRCLRRFQLSTFTSTAERFPEEQLMSVERRRIRKSLGEEVESFVSSSSSINAYRSSSLQCNCNSSQEFI